MSTFQVIVAYGTMDIERMLTYAAARASDEQLVIGIGIVRAPFTKSWHVCLSRDGGPFTWVSSHRLKRDAEQQIAEVKQLGLNGDLRDDSVFARVLHDMAGHSDIDVAAEPRVLGRDRRLTLRARIGTPRA